MRKLERSRAARLVLGGSADPPWARPALIGVLAVAAVLDTWALSINEWANTYYSATVLGMTRSWEAFFYGSLDAASFITVDKPPLALWVQALSARAFGFNSWSLLVPQAVFAVLTVLVLHHLVRRSFGHAAGLLAALVLAVTPIAVAMARHNNPDALLVLLTVLALWAASNAIRSGKALPLVWCAVAIGLAFNVKMLQAYFVLPVIAVAYLVAARPRWPRKLLHLGTATAVLAVVSASWMVAVDAVPADSRPYIGGSTDNTVLDLLLGYNGLGRVFGQDHIASPGMMGGGPGGGPQGGMPGQLPPGGPGGGGPGGDDGGLTRLIGDQVAGQISWLFPLALCGMIAALVHLRRRPRHNAQRADFLLWAGTLLVTAAVFSFASGIWHPYYTVALAPPLAAVVGIGVVCMVRLFRVSTGWGALLPTSIAATGAWAYHLLDDDFAAWLPPLIAVLTAVSVLVLALLLAFPRQRRMRRARPGLAAVLAGLVAMLSGPTAYSLTPLSTPIQATFPSAGPSGQDGPGTGPGGGGPGGRGGPGGQGGQRAPAPQNQNSAPDGRANAPDGQEPGGRADGSIRGGPGGGSTEVNDQVVRYLTAHHRDETWLVAVVGAMVAAPIILDTGQPVMAVGGYNGNDPAPTADALQSYVREGTLRYVWTDGTSGVRSMGSEVDTRVVDESMAWVAQHCTAVDPTAYGGTEAATGTTEAQTRLYDCKAPH
ncbi:glycosyltransferase family 39 protein [Saccharopolyspora sp. NFXS83]|uniref:ArnT family glycosyltransferase n=1 Tax=Saccharopolyspora sp. NFXS83 TaxID=2993560 RepID=UPI00224B793D|nr:glycosyltransferase family 39 protein [Saccharopolyspora sp. NFXS83]MCX2733649.1 glycosyltransferase family 39 protein [Saccharopolyspora sp. NFXS83]